MKSIITLGRQLGSSGKLIGKALAEQLGIPFYDKALVARTAKESGLSEHLFDGVEEKPTHSLLYSLVMGVQSTKGLYYQYNDMLNGDNIFKIQADVIRSIADEGPCIIVGRCADYILRDHPHVIRLFLCADEDHRIKTLMNRDGMSEKEAISAVNKADKRRANYYNFYTNKTWGDVKNYDLCLNTGELTQEECVKILVDYIATREAYFND
jgi:cytidylate kinase